LVWQKKRSGLGVRGNCGCQPAKKGKKYSSLLEGKRKTAGNQGKGDKVKELSRRGVNKQSKKRAEKT